MDETETDENGGSRVSANCSPAKIARRAERLIVNDRATLSLDFPALVLGLEPAFLRCQRRPRCPSRLRYFSGFAYQFDQSANRCLTVARLIAILTGIDDEHAGASHPAAGEFAEARANRIRQRWRMRSIETQLHRAFYLVYVLPAGAGRAHEVEREFGFIQRDSIVDVDQDT